MKHLHTLRRVNSKTSKDLFMCADPECNWTRKKEFLIGKKFRCPLCGGEYIADADILRRKLPHCKDCTSTKVDTGKLASIPNLLNDVLATIPEVVLEGIKET